jgi:zinc protease
MNKDLKPYVDAVGTRGLIDTPPAPGKIAKESKRADLAIDEWVLSNGVKVILKPTTFKEDEIVFRATSPGGTSLASDADFFAVNSAAQIIPAGGVGPFNAIDLRKVLTGKLASATPTLSDFTTGMAGSSSKSDVETLFQLIYLRFTQPRADPTIFGVLSAQVKSLLVNQLASPDVVFAQTMTSTLTQDHPRKRPTTPATIDQWNLDKSLAFYKARFADASGFTFVFVGSFDPEAMKPLVERYLGALPSTNRHETWKDTGVRPPTGIVEKTIEQGVEPKSQVAMAFTGPFEADDAHRLALKAMAAVLQSRLLSTIREQLGGTYSISVSQVTQKIPIPQYSVGIQWACDPQRTADLVTRVFQEIELTKNILLNDRQVDVIRQAFQQEFDTNSKQNAWLANQMALKGENGEDIASIWEAPGDYRALTGAMIQQAAREYLNTANYVKITLVPAKK